MDPTGIFDPTAMRSTLPDTWVNHRVALCVLAGQRVTITPTDEQARRAHVAAGVTIPLRVWSLALIKATAR